MPQKDLAPSRPPRAPELSSFHPSLSDGLPSPFGLAQAFTHISHPPRADLNGDRPPSMRDGWADYLTEIKVGDGGVQIRPVQSVEVIKIVRFGSKNTRPESAGFTGVVWRRRCCPPPLEKGRPDFSQRNRGGDLVRRGWSWRDDPHPSPLRFACLLRPLLLKVRWALAS